MIETAVYIEIIRGVYFRLYRTNLKIIELLSFMLYIYVINALNLAFTFFLQLQCLTENIVLIENAANMESPS